jgi:hypothetical protein
MFSVIMAFRTIIVRIDSPDFWPPTQSRTIRVPAVGDSPPITFLLTPVQLGDLRIKVELYLGETVVLSRVLRTSATNSDRIPAQVPQTVLTIPIAVVLPKDVDLSATLSSGLQPRSVLGDHPQLLDTIVEAGRLGRNEEDTAASFAKTLETYPPDVFQEQRVSYERERAVKTSQTEKRPGAENPVQKKLTRVGPPAPMPKSTHWRRILASRRKLALIAAGITLFALLLLALRVFFH